MKTLHFLFGLIIYTGTCSNFRAQTVAFTYDEGGNMTQRSLQVMMGERIAYYSKKDSVLLPELNLKVFPNPTNTNLNIEGSLPEKVSSAELILLNVNGQILKKDTYSGELKSMNVEDLKSGMYILEVRYSKKKRATYKIIVTN